MCGSGILLTLVLSLLLYGRLFLRWLEVQDSHLPSTYKGDFCIILRHILCHSQVVILIMHPGVLCDFPVEIPVVEFARLHTVFKLLFPCFFQDVNKGVAKINDPDFLPFCRADFVLMGSAVVADTPADCQALFLKVDVLPSQPCHFPKLETCEIRYLYGQDCVFAPLAKLCNQLLVLLK